MEIYNRLILELYGAAQDCTPAEFAEHALLQLKQVVDFDSAAVMNVDALPTAKMAVRSMHLSNQPADQLLTWDGLETQDHVLIEALQRRGTVIARNSRDVFGGHADFMAYCEHFDIANTLILIPPETTPNNYDLISLWRARPTHRYSRADGMASGLLLPHFFQAAQINRRLAARDAGAATRVSALANLAGDLHFVPDDAIALLQREWRQWTPPSLPDELMQTLAASPSRSYIGSHITVKAQTLGPTLHLLVTPQPAAARLTGAERKVAGLAAHGMSYKEIARELGNSPATIRNQLHSIYAKLGVDNKTQLSATLSTILLP